jgi:hypothetical protein
MNLMKPFSRYIFRIYANEDTQGCRSNDVRCHEVIEILFSVPNGPAYSRKERTVARQATFSQSARGRFEVRRSVTWR